MNFSFQMDLKSLGSPHISCFLVSDPSGADLTLGLVFFLLQLWFSSSPVHTKRHSGLPYCHIARSLKCGDGKPCEQDGIGEMVKARL